MRTRVNKYKIPWGFSVEESTIKRFDKIQTDYLLDRSTVLRIIMQGMTDAEFVKFFNRQQKSVENKRRIDTKLMFKKNKK